jgi:hypothetical protein
MDFLSIWFPTSVIIDTSIAVLTTIDGFLQFLTPIDVFFAMEVEKCSRQG